MPTNIRLELLKSILLEPTLRSVRIFVEKPYASTVEEVEHLTSLIEKYGKRIHLAGKYSKGRADILYKHLPKNKLPNAIYGSILEGLEYYSYVKNRIASEGNHAYLQDGPEIDLGFHLLDIICSQFCKSIENLEIISVDDLSNTDSQCEANFCMAASLKMTLKSGIVIPVQIQAGKYEGDNVRFVEFDYSDETIGQLYSTKNSQDPVYKLKMNKTKIVETHPLDHLYYFSELSNEIFCRQSISEQLLKLKVMEMCLDMKQIRKLKNSSLSIYQNKHILTK